MSLQDGIYLPPEDTFLPFYPASVFLGDGVVLTGKAAYQKFIAIKSKLSLHGWLPLVCPDGLKVGRCLFQSKTETTDSGKKLNDTDLLHDRYLAKYR